MPESSSSSNGDLEDLDFALLEELGVTDELLEELSGPNWAEATIRGHEARIACTPIEKLDLSLHSCEHRDLIYLVLLARDKLRHGILHPAE